jgi:NitT/TauT family transport system substrate-binding protein
MLKKYIVLKMLVMLISAVPFNIYAAASIEKPVVRLGSLKFAPYGAVSYVKELAPSCGIHVDERIYNSGAEIMAAIAAKEIEVGANTAEVAIAGRASGVPVYIVAGIAKGGMRLVVRAGLNIRTLHDLKRKKIGVTRGGAQELFLYTRLNQVGLINNKGLDKDV